MLIRFLLAIVATSVSRYGFPSGNSPDNARLHALGAALPSATLVALEPASSNGSAILSGVLINSSGTAMGAANVLSGTDERFDPKLTSSVTATFTSDSPGACSVRHLPGPNGIIPLHGKVPCGMPWNATSAPDPHVDATSTAYTDTAVSVVVIPMVCDSTRSCGACGPPPSSPSMTAWYSTLVTVFNEWQIYRGFTDTPDNMCNRRARRRRKRVKARLRPFRPKRPSKLLTSK